VRADDIVLVDAFGEKVAGRHQVEPTALFIHAAVHRIANRRCVLHTHMPYATSLTMTEARGLDTRLLQTSMTFHGRVAIDKEYNGLALDHTEGERIARALGDKDVAFLGNHGVVVCGDRMDYAFNDLYYLERACQAQVLAESTGRKLEPVPEEMARRVSEQAFGERLQSELFFEALRRTLR
jgi:ribulose-5-phosphate 4-epimerase/fuculose-1-phosphate aldolase